MAVLRHVKEGYDGAWMDIISSVFFNMAGMRGEHVEPWNSRKDRVYTPDEYREGHERKISFIQEYVKKRMGRYPFLIANNFRGIRYDPGQGGDSLLLKPTKVKPRPLDAYCMENSIGSMEGEQMDLGNEDGWRIKVSSIARCAQDGIAAYPIIGPGGSKAKRLEPDTPTRDRLERFGYASYLLGVEKNGKTAFGIQAVYSSPDGKRTVKLNEQYYYPIGDPAETRKWEEFSRYKAAGTHTYVRRFANGIVLVNPSDKPDKEVQLGAAYLDPRTGSTVSAVDMEPQTGRILLKPQVK